jgi:hypothetical protein
VVYCSSAKRAKKVKLKPRVVILKRYESVFDSFVVGHLLRIMHDEVNWG